MKPIKSIIGYIDYFGHVHSHVVFQGDSMDSHNQVWPSRIAAHGKWRWTPDKANHLNTYGEDIEDYEFFAIFDVIRKHVE